MGLFSSKKTNVDTDVSVSIESNPVVNVDVAPLVDATRANNEQIQSLLEDFLAASVAQNKSAISGISGVSNKIETGLLGFQNTSANIGQGLNSASQNISGGAVQVAFILGGAFLASTFLKAIA